LQELSQRHSIISTRLLSGKTVIHVESDQQPGPSFEPATVDLEDVYFSTLAAHRGSGHDIAAEPIQ
jgi:hypothetical protein